jgi:hypothetical protein
MRNPSKNRSDVSAAAWDLPAPTKWASMTSAMSMSDRKQIIPARTGAASGLYPLRVGTWVTVLRMSPAGPSIEGRAIIEGIARGPNCYRLQFSGDPITRERVVHPDYQHKPERMLQIMLDIWRASTTPAVPDFFPEENT